MGDRNFVDQLGRTITYDQVREAQGEEHYTMVLTTDDSRYTIEAVNQGIDAHLEACYVPELGDSYEPQETRIKGKLLAVKLSCVVSVISLPILLRRLFEAEEEGAHQLAQDVLDTIGLGEE